VPADVHVLKNSSLDEVPLDFAPVAYCQPFSGTFGSLDSFILDNVGKKCFGLQMTLNKHHGIKLQPLH
jgi:hypothetical protein